MIRNAELADIPTLIEYSNELYLESTFSRYLDNSRSKMERNFDNMIRSDDSLVLIADDAFIVCSVMPMFFSVTKVAQELMWWVAPESRGMGLGRELRDSMEQWARGKRVPAIFCASQRMQRDNAADPLLLESGFVMNEKCYVKEL